MHPSMAKEHAFVLDVRDLDAGGKPFQAVVSSSWLKKALADTEVTATGEGSLIVRYSRTGTDVVVRGRIKAPLQVPCARCTEPASLPVDTELSLLLVPEGSSKAARARGKTGPSKEAQLADEEAGLDTYSGDEVVLDDFVREALLLEVPPFPLCSDACPGIAPPPAEGAGSDDIDPRLAPLRKLLKN
jgi:uncharacterized protein